MFSVTRVRMKLILACVALLGLSWCSLGYEVPEPLFEVFKPKGLRVSIPDSDDVESVQFSLTIKSGSEETTELFGDLEKSEQERWMYWNPEVEVNENDVIYYMVTVEEDDMYWTKEGEHRVDKAYSTSGEPVETVRLPRLGYRRPGMGDLFRHAPGSALVGEGKMSSYQSSYSSYQSGDAPPVTRSSTLSKSGTYVLKPNGESEASGYKKISSDDSSSGSGRRVSESEFTESELEELRNYFGPKFRSFPNRTPEQGEEFDRTFFRPERLSATDSDRDAGTRSYEESYFQRKSQSSSSSRNDPDFGRHSVAYEHSDRNSGRYGGYHQGIVNPPRAILVSTPFSAAPDSSQSNHFSLRSHTNTAKDEYSPLSAQVDSVSYNTETRQADSRSQSHTAASPMYSPRNSYQPTGSGSTSTTFGRRVENYDSRTSTTSVQRQSDYDASDNRHEQEDDVQKVQSPYYEALRPHYRGSIFRIDSMSSVHSPQECSVWAENNYSIPKGVEEMQKSISKIQCMASVAEHSIKEELRLLQQSNQDLQDELGRMRREFATFKSRCNCSG